MLVQTIECSLGLLNTCKTLNNYKFSLLNINAKHWIKLWLAEYKNPHIERKIVVTYWILRNIAATGINNKKSLSMITIRSRKVNLHSLVLMNWFPVLNCWVLLIAMLEAENMVKGFQIHPFWVIAREEWFLMRQIHDNPWNRIMLSQPPSMWKN